VTRFPAFLGSRTWVREDSFDFPDAVPVGLQPVRLAGEEGRDSGGGPPGLVCATQAGREARSGWIRRFGAASTATPSICITVRVSGRQEGLHRNLALGLGDSMCHD